MSIVLRRESPVNANVCLPVPVTHAGARPCRARVLRFPALIPACCAYCDGDSFLRVRVEKNSRVLLYRRCEACHRRFDCARCTWAQCAARLACGIGAYLCGCMLMYAVVVGLLLAGGAIWPGVTR